MQVNIKKEGKKETYNLINSWSEVTLEKWAKLISPKDKSKSQEALDTISSLSDIPKKLVKELAINDVAVILDKISNLQKDSNSTLKNIITVEGKEYGFCPDLSEISLGEYADIETFLTNSLEKNMHKIMAVLYRPIVEKSGKYYSIEAYESSSMKLRAQVFKKMKAEDVNSCLVFFWSLGSELSTILPLSLMARTQKILKTLQTKTSQENGIGSV